MSRPADQGQLAIGLRDLGRVHGLAAQDGDDLATARPMSRIAVQQFDAEADQVLRQPFDERPRRGRRLGPLGDDQFLRRADEREPTGQDFVEHDADAVPIARRRDREPGRLLRGHVRQRADDLPVQAPVQARTLQVRSQPEIEQDDTALAGHQDVRGLDVPMQLPGLVERIDALGQLPEGIAEAGLIETDRSLGREASPGQPRRRPLPRPEEWPSAGPRRARCPPSRRSRSRTLRPAPW